MFALHRNKIFTEGIQFDDGFLFLNIFMRAKLILFWRIRHHAAFTQASLNMDENGGAPGCSYKEILWVTRSFCETIQNFLMEHSKVASQQDGREKNTVEFQYVCLP